MPREIDKDIELVLIDDFRDFFIRQSSYILPMVDHRRKFSARIIFFAIGIAENFKAAFIIIMQERITEKRHDMEMQIRRNIANPYFRAVAAPLFMAILRYLRE